MIQSTASAALSQMTSAVFQRTEIAASALPPEEWASFAVEEDIENLADDSIAGFVVDQTGLDELRAFERRQELTVFKQNSKADTILSIRQTPESAGPPSKSCGTKGSILDSTPSVGSRLV